MIIKDYFSSKRATKLFVPKGSYRAKDFAVNNNCVVVNIIKYSNIIFTIIHTNITIEKDILIFKLYNLKMFTYILFKHL